MIGTRLAGSIEDELVALSEGKKKLYRRWLLADNPGSFDSADIVFVGGGYVILRDGSRVDMLPDRYRDEREAWNMERAGMPQPFRAYEARFQ